jgi:hypothetical protein
MSKLKRAVQATWLSQDQKDWTLIGKDMDSMSMSLNPDVETKKNILGENVTDHSGYNPELDVDSYLARTEDAIYEPIKDIAMNRLSDEESTTFYLMEAILTDEVKNSDTTTLKGEAWVEKVTVVPQEYGGDTNGFSIPFNIYANGDRKKGTVSVTKRVPTFEEAAE